MFENGRDLAGSHFREIKFMVDDGAGFYGW